MSEEEGAKKAGYVNTASSGECSMQYAAALLVERQAGVPAGEAQVPLQRRLPIQFASARNSGSNIFKQN